MNFGGWTWIIQMSNNRIFVYRPVLEQEIGTLSGNSKCVCAGLIWNINHTRLRFWRKISEKLQYFEKILLVHKFKAALPLLVLHYYIKIMYLPLLLTTNILLLTHQWRFHLSELMSHVRLIILFTRWISGINAFCSHLISLDWFFFFRVQTLQIPSVHSKARKCKEVRNEKVRNK